MLLTGLLLLMLMLAKLLGLSADRQSLTPARLETANQLSVRLIVANSLMLLPGAANVRGGTNSAATHPASAVEARSYDCRDDARHRVEESERQLHGQRPRMGTKTGSLIQTA